MQCAVEKEDGEGTEHHDERGGPVDQFPGLDDPRCEESDDGAPTDINVMREETRKVDPAGDCIAADVFKNECQQEPEGEEEDACAHGRRGVAAVHHGQ